jgi:hypothetical protein
MPTMTPRSGSAFVQTAFILSPARTDGRRGQALLDRRATLPLAVRLREQGVAIGELFTFVSGLYFRGKLAYASAYAQTRSAPHGVLVIVPGMGLVPPETAIRLSNLRTIGAIGVEPEEPRFREPLERDAAALAARFSESDRVVLLGSIATGKYVDALGRHLGARLHFPVAFVGRGDMSRGGLMLRCVDAGRELEYMRVEGAVRRGQRPPRLERIRGSRTGRVTSAE